MKKSPEGKIYFPTKFIEMWIECEKKNYEINKETLIKNCILYQFDCVFVVCYVRPLVCFFRCCCCCFFFASNIIILYLLVFAVEKLVYWVDKIIVSLLCEKENTWHNNAFFLSKKKKEVKCYVCVTKKKRRLDRCIRKYIAFSYRQLSSAKWKNNNILLHISYYI